MSHLRNVAEWAFKEMVNTFGFLDYMKNQKLLLQPLGIQFRVAALLHNSHIGLHKPLIMQYFEIGDLNTVGLERTEELIED